MTINTNIKSEETLFAKSGLAGVEVQMINGEIVAVRIGWYNQDRSGSGWRKPELYEISQFADLRIALIEMTDELAKRGIVIQPSEKDDVTKET